MLHYLALRLGLLAARLIPLALLSGLFAAAFRFAAPVHPARRRVAANLRRLDASGRATPGDVLANYGRYWAETLALGARPGLLARLRVDASGAEHLDAALAAGPVCLLSGHLGNWDLLGAWVAARTGGMTVAAEALEPRRLFELYVRLRRRAGVEVLAADRSGLRFHRELKRRRVIGLIADRVFGAGWRAVDFCGGRRRFPSAGMDLARRAGASLLPIFLLREGSGYVIKVHPPLPREGDPVVAFAGALEAELRARPEQWCVLYPLHDDGVGADAQVSGRVKGATA